MKNRSRVEILYDIVSASRGSAKKTHLMYKSNLSFKQLRLYLDFLLYRDLIEEKIDPEVEGGRIYSPTAKGLQFLTLFLDLQGFLGVNTAVEPMQSHSPDSDLSAVPIIAETRMN
jgi:predicted transcriptional regulator